MKKIINGRVCLLGDCAHMGSPRTGAGAYTAMLDAIGFGQAYEKAHGNVEKTL